MARDIVIERLIEEQREVCEVFKTNANPPSHETVMTLMLTQLEIMERILDSMPNRADSAGYLLVQFHDRKRDQPWRQ